MGQLNRQKFLELCETVFFLLFFLYTILGFNSLTNGIAVISVVMWPAYILGAGLLVVRFWNWKDYIKMPGLILLLLMCAVCAVSILVNHQYNLKKNIIYLISWVFYFFMFYMQSRKADPELLQKRVRMAGHLICLGAFCLAGISLVMMFTGYSEIVEVNGNELIRGFTHGRLYGAYLTPNGGAVVASIVIFLTIHFIGRYKKKLYTVYGVVNILIQFLYIVFSDSRSGTLSLALGGAAYVLFAVLGSPRFQNCWARSAISVGLALLVLFGGLFGPSKVQDIYNSAVNMIAQSITADQPDNVGVSEETQKGTEQIIKKYTVNRGYDLSKDPTNRRFDIWKSGLEIFAREPLLGTTFCGFTAYALEYMPETYIVNNDYMDMNTFDNDFVNLLVSNGIIAFLAFVVFIVWVLIVLLRRGGWKTNKQFPVMLGVCMAAATFSMFTSGVLYMQSPFSALFWLALGTMVTMSSKQEGTPND